MRNLKKILALVLAMSMLFSMTAFAGFTDAAKIDEDYAEAVTVLNDMGIFKGYDNGAFGPKDNLTRAMVAAIIYRIATGDVEDEKADLFAGAANFSDVADNAWYAGYVGYCANAGYVLGCGDGTFNPDGNVTGFEALAMILRAMGYDAQKEFTGMKWTDEIAKVATKAGILNDVKPGVLAGPASRELIAQLLFAAIQADTVRYTPAFGYHTGYKSLGVENFKLAGPFDTTDDWGRPGYKYTYSTGEESTSFSVKPIATYTEAVTECEVAVDAGIKTTKTYDLWVNGVKTSDTIYALDTVDTIGAQGRLTEVYKDRIVMIDTFLAKVTAVADATYDAAGHLKTESKLTMTVYDGSNTVDVMTNGKTNYGYEAGDYVLVNSLTKSGDRDVAGAITGVKTVILGLADSEVGTQTVIWYHIGQHTINNTTYTDAAEFNLNEAGDKIAPFTWFFDQYGNVIGSVEIATKYDYAVLKNIWWSGDNTTGAGKAMGTLVYMDGSENVVTLKKIEGYTPAYSTEFADIMKCYNSGKIYVATDAASNASRDANAFIKGHLFRVYDDGKGVTLTKVADAAGNHTEIQKATIINKLTWINGLYIDANTQFLVKGTSTTAGFKTYTGMNALPTFQEGAVVDYVKGANGVAKYVYIIGDPVSATDANFVLINSKGYSAVLKTTADGVNYYEITLPVPAEDGSVVTLKTKSADILAELTDITNVGKLFYVSYTDGYATKVELITSAIHTFDKVQATKLTNVTYAGNVIMGGVYRFNVTEATTVVGDLNDLTGKVVYVIFDGTINNASKVYVLDVAVEYAPEVIPSDWTVDADGFGYNNKTTQLIAPAGTTIRELYNKWECTGYKVVYTVTNANGFTAIKTETSGMGDYTIDSLLANGAVITMTNAYNTWTVID